MMEFCTPAIINPSTFEIEKKSKSATHFYLAKRGPEAQGIRDNEGESP